MNSDFDYVAGNLMSSVICKEVLENNSNLWHRFRMFYHHLHTTTWEYDELKLIKLIFKEVCTTKSESIFTRSFETNHITQLTPR